MKKTFTLIFAAILICSISNAKIFRVGYNGIALSGVDYASLDLAENAATDGDTIQIYGSVSGGTINKRLVILGFGYNFDAHPGLQAVGTNAPSSVSVTFGKGSDGSFISGISGQFDISDASGTHTAINNITIFRCYASIYLWDYYPSNPNYGSTISNIKILSSVVNSLIQYSTQYGVNSPYALTNLQVFNCYVYGVILKGSSTSAVFVNCVTGGPSYLGNYTLTLNDAGVLVRNCILINYGAGNINTVFENNFFTVTQPTVLPAGSNNRWGQTYTTLYNGVAAGEQASTTLYGNFDENYFILKPGSPAINGGIDGNGNPTDCGIFGGEAAYVYKLSGVPAIPAIYKLTAPSLNANSNPYNVTISVKSNN